jgi:hypothetical protein
LAVCLQARGYQESSNTDIYNESIKTERRIDACYRRFAIFIAILTQYFF